MIAILCALVLRRQRPRRLRLFLTDRLFWVWLYRVRPQLLDTLVLVKPATVIGWHRKGFRIYWRWRSRRSGRSKTGRKSALTSATSADRVRATHFFEHPLGRSVLKPSGARYMFPRWGLFFEMRNEP